MRLHRIIVVGLIFGLITLVAGCASTTDSSSSSSDSSSSGTAATPAKPTPTENIAKVPKSSKLAKVELGMSDSQVRTLLGEPSNIRSYPTGKNWIPFYFGGDTYRFDWSYRNVGKVVFGNTSRFSRAIIVVDVIHNPDEA